MKVYIVEVEQINSGSRNIMSRGYKSLEEAKRIALPAFGVKEINPYTYITENGEIYRIQQINIFELG